MKNKPTIIAIIIIVVALIVGIIIVNKVQSQPSKYASFVECLKEKGLIFYGAFWCPHCQAQEAEFKMSRQAIESAGLYKECSLPSGTGQTQICIDKHIESYPTWEFPTPIVVTSKDAPTVCPTTDKLTASSPATCQQLNSPTYTSYIFSTAGEGLVVQTTTAPVQKDATWTFDNATSRTTGGQSLDFLAEQSKCVLPQ